MRTIGVTVSEHRSFPVELRELETHFNIIEINPGELGAQIGECDIVYLWNLAYDELQEVFNKDTKLPNTIYVARQGEDEWLIDQTRDARVDLRYAKDVFSDVIAEYVIASLFMLSKNLHLVAIQSDWIKQYNYSMRGSTALILGRGNIALQVESMLKSNNVSVQKISRKEVRSIASGELDAASSRHMQDVDHVICCIPDDSKMAGVLGLDFFSHFKDVNFVNISRGSLLDMKAFGEALDTGAVRAALLDVFELEPLPKDNSLWTDERVVVSPHHSYRSIDWDQRLHRGFIEYLRSDDKIE